MVLVACTSPVSPSPEPELTQSPDLCSGIEQWATEASKYDDSLSDVCSGNPNVLREDAAKCRQAALNAWQSLSEMSPPLITVSAHDTLRRAMVYQFHSANDYLDNPRESLFQASHNESVDLLRDFRERRDLMLAFCGYNLSEFLADIEWAHTVDNYNQQMMLADDPVEYERLKEEKRKIIDDHIARPADERVHAVELIKSIAGKEAVVEYLYTTDVLESYAVGLTLFVIDRTSDTLIQINEVPRNSTSDPKRELDLTPRFTQEELDRMAREFIQTYAPYVDLDSLIPDHHFAESSQYYWFRWNTAETKHVFVQIAYTPAGEIVAYTNAINHIIGQTQEATK